MEARFYNKVLVYPKKEDYNKQEEFRTAYQEFLSNLPQRQNFIKEDIQKQIVKDMHNGKEVLFLPNITMDMNIKCGRELIYMIYMLGITRDGSTASMQLMGYEPWFDVQVPSGIKPDAFTKVLMDLAKDNRWIVARWDSVQMRPGKLLHEKPCTYIRMVFKNLLNRRTAFNYLTANKINYYDELINQEVSVDVVTGFDELTNYHRTVSRELKLPFTKWMSLSNYELLHPVDEHGDIQHSAFVSNINQVGEAGLAKRNVRYQFKVNYKNAKPYTTDITNVPDLLKDHSMEMLWDLETSAIKFTGDAPQVKKVFNAKGELEDVVFMGGTAFYWYWSNSPMLVVGFTDLPQPPRKDCLIIQVSDQTDIIKIKALLLERMTPQFVAGFNDGRYDWPFILRRIKEYDRVKGTDLSGWFRKKSSVLPDIPVNQYYNRGKSKHDVKQEAGVNIVIKTWEMPMFIPIDVRVIFQQLYPTAEQSSLKFFLDKEKLSSKEDMPYITMFRIYRLMRQIAHMIGSSDYDTILRHMKTNWMEEFGPEGYPLTNQVMEDNPFRRVDASTYQLDTFNTTELIKLAEQSSEVMHYCNVDAMRCHDLLKRRNIIADKRETAALSFVSFYDAVFYAGGMKVRNKVLSEASKPQWMLSLSNSVNRNRGKDPRKFPGAYVMFPRQGLYRDHKYIKSTRVLGKYSPLLYNELLPDVAKNGIQQKYMLPINPEFKENVKPITLAIQAKVQELLDKTMGENAPVKVINLGDIPVELDKLSDPLKIIYEKVKKSFSLTRNELDELMRNNDLVPMTDEGCSGLDFASLYPNIIINFNLSPEMCIRDEALMRRLVGKINPRTGQVYRFVEVQFHYKLPTEAKKPEQLVRAWFAQYEMIMVDGKPTYKGMGIYPFILKDIFDMRAALKGNLEWHTCAKEFLGTVIDNRKKAKMPALESLPMQQQLEELLKVARDNWQAKLKEANETKKEVHRSWAHAAENAVRYIWKEWIGIADKLTTEELLTLPVPETPYSELPTPIQSETSKYGIDPEFVAAKKIQERREQIKKHMQPKLDFSQFFDEYVNYYWNYYNSKQLALKVFMNTFYGETGNSLSPFFIVEVAGGVTYLGQLEIKWVKKTVTSWGFNVLYCDTDSAYTQPGSHFFKEINELFESGKIDLLEYWQRKVDRAMEVMNECRDRINAELKKRHNGKAFLKMAYEEVLFPFIMFGKKKYFGVKHESLCKMRAVMADITLNEFMSNRDLFIKGLELKKRGSSAMLKQACFMVLMDALNVTNAQTLREITEGMLHKITTINWDAKMFARNAKYKEKGRKADGTEKKGNPVVQGFMDRMIDLYANHSEFGIKPRDLGERYDYIIATKYPYKYDMRGRKTPIKTADKCEFFELTNQRNGPYEEYLGGPIVPDVDFYVLNEVCGQYARFLVYHPDFNPDYNRVMANVDQTLLEDKQKEMDKIAVKKAKTYLQSTYENKYAKSYPEYGTALKETFKRVEAKHADMWASKYGARSTILRLGVNVMSMASEELRTMPVVDVNSFIETLYKLADKKVIKEIDNFVTVYKDLDLTTAELYKIQLVWHKREEENARVINKTVESRIKAIWAKFQNITGLELMKINEKVTSIYEWINPSNTPVDKTSAEFVPIINDDTISRVLSNKTINEGDDHDMEDVLEVIQDCLYDLVAIRNIRIKRTEWIRRIRDKMDRELKRPASSAPKQVQREMRASAATTAQELKAFLKTQNVSEGMNI